MNPDYRVDHGIVCIEFKFKGTLIKYAKKNTHPATTSEVLHIYVRNSSLDPWQR